MLPARSRRGMMCSTRCWPATRGAPLSSSTPSHQVGSMRSPGSRQAARAASASTSLAQHSSDQRQNKKMTAVRRLGAILKLLGLPAQALHAGMQQRARLKALDRFKARSAVCRCALRLVLLRPTVTVPAPRCRLCACVGPHSCFRPTPTPCWWRPTWRREAWTFRTSGEDLLPCLGLADDVRLEPRI